MRFIIIGLQRSGTTVLTLLLNEHPDVSFFEDELKIEPLFTEGIMTFGMGNIPEQDVNDGYIKLFDALSKKSTAHWGAKVALQEPKQAKQLIRSLNKNFPGLHIFIINREDSIARIGSLIKARKSGLYHSWSKGKALASFHIPRRIFELWYLKECWIKYELEQLESDKVIRLSYNMCFGNEIDPNFIYKKLGFREIGEIELKSKKVSPKAQDYIKNYFDLKRLKENIDAKKIDFGVGYKDPLSTRIRIKLIKIYRSVFQ